MKMKHSANAYNARREKTERNREICRLRRTGMTFLEIGVLCEISEQMAHKIFHRDKGKYGDD